MTKDKTVEDKTGTVLRACVCESPYQDSKYGRGIRVFNLSHTKKKGKAFCSVCGRAL